MADSRMVEEEGHCNLLLEMIKEERKNVNVTPSFSFWLLTNSGRLLDVGDPIKQE